MKFTDKKTIPFIDWSLFESFTSFELKLLPLMFAFFISEDDNESNVDLGLWVILYIFSKYKNVIPILYLIKQ